MKYDEAIYVRVSSQQRENLNKILEHLHSKGYDTSLSDLMRAGATKVIREFNELLEKGEI